MDGRLAIDKGQVASCVLLVAELSTPLTSVEDKVAKESTTPFLHVDTRVAAVGCLRQLEDDVLYGGRLRRWPVDSPGCVRN